MSSVAKSTRRGTLELTSASLIRQMGGGPRAELRVFGRLFKVNSIAYKDVLKEARTFETQLNAFAGQPSVPQIEEMAATLNRMIAATRAYDRRHSLNPFKAQRRRVMQEVAALAQQKIQALQATKPGVFQKASAGRSIDPAAIRKMLQLGLPHAYQHVAEVAVLSDAQETASGAMNTVRRAQFPGEDSPRFLKLAPQRVAPEVLSSATDQLLAFDPAHPRLVQRNVASANFAAQLGRPDLIPMPNTVLGSDGEIYLAMKAAPGEPLCRTVSEPVTGDVLEEIQACETEEDRQAFLSMFADMGWAVTFDGSAWVKQSGQAIAFPYVDDGTQPARCAALQQALLDLQTIHAAVGQIDGHGANIFVCLTPEGVVVNGIDNDLSFPEKPGTLDPVAPPDPKGHHYLGMPPLISREAYRHLLALEDANIEALMGDGFPQGAVAAMKERVTRMQARAQEMERSGLVVDDFQTWRKEVDGKALTVSEYLTRADTPNNYVKKNHEPLVAPNGAAAGAPPQPDKHKLDLEAQVEGHSE